MQDSLLHPGSRETRFSALPTASTLCAADEGDSDTFSDRMLMELDRLDCLTEWEPFALVYNRNHTPRLYPPRA